MKAIFTVGVSASGKTTWAKEYCKETRSVNINRDDIRTSILISEGSISDPAYIWTKWSFKRESEVNSVVNDQIMKAKQIGADVVFSDTNLNQGRLKSAIEKMESLGYECEVKYFVIPGVDVAIKRDRKRSPCVGENVIRNQWKQWLALGEEVTGIRPYIKNKNLPTAIVVDIDGTIADYGDHRGPFEWDKVHLDDPRREIISIVRAMRADTKAKVIVLSGRDSICRAATLDWIEKFVHFDDFELYMRPHSSMEKDRIVKEKLFFDHVADRFSVMFAIDDRKQMIHFWNDIGVTCVNVGSPYDEF